MSRDLLEQLAEYGDQVRAGQRPIELADVLEPRDRPVTVPVRVDGKEITMLDTADRRMGSGRRWLVAVAAAAVVAIVVGGAVALFSDDDATNDELVTTDTSAEVTAPDTIAPVGPEAEPEDQPAFVVPADALEEPSQDVVGPTGETPLPDFENAVAGDDGGPRLPLGEIEELPESVRLDFLAQFCASFLDGRCFRDAVFTDSGGSEADSAAGSPFHVRHGFVNGGADPLPDAFDLALYVFPLPLADFSDDRAAIGPTQRFTTDYVIRGETDACGPDYESQTGTVTCEWFVHDFPDGLPEGRWALWAVWEAPCSAWIELGRTDECADPDEVMSFFSSGVDSPFDAPMDQAVATDAAGTTAPVGTQFGAWTRVERLGIHEVISDGQSYIGRRWNGTSQELLRSDDGVRWEQLAEFDDWHDVAFVAGRVITVEGNRSSATLRIFESGGATTTHEVPLEVPEPFAPFSRRLQPVIGLLDEGQVTVHANYWADENLVLLAAVGVPLETVAEYAAGPEPFCDDPDDPDPCEFPYDDVVAAQLDIPLADLRQGDIGFGPDYAVITFDDEDREFSFSELGLHPLWSYQRSLAATSSDLATWTQVETDAEMSVSGIARVPGGLVGSRDALEFARLDERGLAVSDDGIQWRTVTDIDTGERITDSGYLESAQDHAFYFTFGDAGQPQAIWEITADGARPFAGPEAAQAPLELFERYHLGALTVGDAGLAYVVAVDDSMRPPLDETGVRWSTDGTTWTLEPFPDESVTSGTLSVGSSTLVLLTYDNGEPTLWVRDFPG